MSADWVVADASAWMFEGSGFTNGERVPGMVGNEYDRVTAGRADAGEHPDPRPLARELRWLVLLRRLDLVLRAQRRRGVLGRHVRLVAAARHRVPVRARPTSRCKVVKVTENLLRAFAAGPAGAAHPSESNLARFGLRTPSPTSSTTAIPPTTSTLPPPAGVGSTTDR